MLKLLKMLLKNIWSWKAADVWSSLCCTSENHLRVAAAVAVLRGKVAAGTESQRLRVSGFLAQVRRFNGDGRCGPAHRRQLLLLEENAQVSLKGFCWRTDKQITFFNGLKNWKDETGLYCQDANPVHVDTAGCSINTPSWSAAPGVKSVSCPLQTAVRSWRERMQRMTSCISPRNPSSPRSGPTHERSVTPLFHTHTHTYWAK